MQKRKVAKISSVYSFWSQLLILMREKINKGKSSKDRFLRLEELNPRLIGVVEPNFPRVQRMRGETSYAELKAD